MFCWLKDVKAIKEKVQQMANNGQKVAKKIFFFFTYARFIITLILLMLYVAISIFTLLDHYYYLSLLEFFLPLYSKVRRIDFVFSVRRVIYITH